MESAPFIVLQGNNLDINSLGTICEPTIICPDSFVGSLYKKMRELKTFPEAVGKSLRYDLAGIHQFYFLNKYRVWYLINFEKNEVWMLSAMHKKDAERQY